MSSNPVNSITLTGLREPGQVIGSGTISGGPGVQSASSSSAGGSQSTYSSSSGTAATGSTSSTSVSKPGHCP